MTCRRHDMARHEMDEMRQLCFGVLSLTLLSACVRSVRPRGARAADLHEANTSLKKLNISENNIGDEGAKALAEALEATFVLCTRCYRGYGENFVARVRCFSCGSRIFLSVAREVAVLRLVTRVARRETQGVHLGGMRGSLDRDRVAFHVDLRALATP